MYQSAQQQFLTKFFQQLNSGAVKYCVWGNHAGLPATLNGSDLDILVRTSSKPEFYTVLRFCLEEFNGQMVSVYTTSAASHFRVAGFYNRDPWGIMIDVIFDEFFYKGCVYLPKKWAWDFLSAHNGIAVNDLGFSYIAGFLKELLHNGRVKDRYLQNSIVEIRQNADKYRPFFEDVYGGAFYKRLQSEFAKDPAQIDLLALRSLLKRGIGSNKYKVLIDDVKKIGRLFLPSPGYTIAVLGCDGSGKSTIIENIIPTLNDAFHNAVYYEHMRPNCLPSIARLFGKQENFEGGPVTNPHGSSTSGVFGSLFRWAYYMLDYTIGFYLKVWPKKAIRSCVWIFDRYYYDYLIDPRRARVNLPRWLLKAGQFLIPEPDIILCLGADAAAIHQRKPELPLEEVERQVAALKRFCHSHKRAVWIDTGKSIEESSHDALKAILNVMSKRFEGVGF